jgi:branched-chain amino acid transport system substrate-binding protein
VLLAGTAQADVNVGISLPLTGPASGLGIPMKNYFALWPQTVAGEKINLIILDDASDPTNGAKNAKRFVTEDKVDIIMGSAATPVADRDGRHRGRIGHRAARVSRPLSCRPARTTGPSACRNRTAVMAHAMVEHMKKQGVKTVGFLGYTDAYGEGWLKGLHGGGEKERHQGDRGRAFRAAPTPA